MLFFFFNDTATTEIYTLSLHDALPISSTTPPSGRQSSVYCTCPSTSFRTSFVVSVWHVAAAWGPVTSISPMWLTSKRPAAVRTARCSSRMPRYETGISQPPNSMSFAPRRRCASQSGVRRGAASPVTTARSHRAERRTSNSNAGLERRSCRRAGADRRRRRPGFGGGGRVREQHRDRHRPNAARHRRDPGGALARGGELDVADELAVGGAIDADVDHHRTVANPVAAHELRASNRGDDDVRAAHDGGEIAGARVANRHGRVLLEQHERDRLADEVAAADDDGIGTAQLETGLGDEAHDAERGARPQPAAPREQTPLARDREPVDVLCRRDRSNDRVLVERVGERQLHQDTVHVEARVQLFDERHELRRRRIGGQPVPEGAHPERGAAFLLRADVDARRRVVADEDRRETGDDTSIGERRHPPADLRADPLRHRLAVEDLAHARHLRKASLYLSRSVIVKPTVVSSMTRCESASRRRSRPTRIASHSRRAARRRSSRTATR